MWILPKQLHTSAYVLDTKELGLDSEAFSQICERSLTWRGKDSLSRTWLQRWKRESWMQHLSSRTLRPSHTESFVDAWTSSLEDSRVSHSQLLESVKLLKTPDTSSPTSQTESESANLELFSSKMYKESSVARQQMESQFSNMSSENWKDWVIEQRQEYSQRKKSAHLTRESESSSLGWQTPTTMDIERTPEGMKKRKAYRESIGRKYVEGCLTEQVKNWATPQVTDVRTDVRKPSERSEKANKGGCKNLREEVMQPQNWPTATARDWKGCGNAITRKDGKHRIDNLEAVIKYGHPDRDNPNTNGKSQESQGKLNPDWVEHLMGLPVGWTDLGSWETE